MVLYLQIFNKQNNFLFILAEGLFLKILKILQILA